MAEADPTALTETFVWSDGSIKWTRFGSGPPLIFLHGTPWSSRLWAPIARCFASSFTVYLYDMPGYGESVRPPRDDAGVLYSFQAKAFVALLRHWQEVYGFSVYQAHVVAHDIGGAIALRALLGVDGTEPMPPFASLALVDCGAAFPVDEAFFTLVRQHAGVFEALPPKLHEAMLREYIRGASFKGLRWDQEDTLVAPLLSEDGQAAFYHQIACQRNEEVERLNASFRRLECPLHIIWAEEDTWVPVARAKMLQDRIGGTLHYIAKAGHLVQYDAPEELSFELSRWLRHVTAAAQ